MSGQKDDYRTYLPQSTHGHGYTMKFFLQRLKKTLKIITQESILLFYKPKNIPPNHHHGDLSMVTNILEEEKSELPTN